MVDVEQEELIGAATMNVVLPDTLEMWIERQARSGRYADASEYLLDLIRRDQARTEQMQRLITDGRESGLSDRSLDEILAEAGATSA